MKINFVMSSNKQSRIFNAIIGYFKQYSDDEIIVTKRPMKFGIDTYYYFRPHLEPQLNPNSVVTIHQDLNDDCYNLDSFIKKFEQAGIVVCLNTKQYEDKRISHLMKYLIPHGYNEKLLDIKKNKTDNEKITIGLFSKRYERGVKGEKLLLELFSKLDPLQYNFVFVGANRDDTIKKASAFGFDAQFYFGDNYDVVMDYYSKIDVLLIPSDFEGGPACLQEGLVTNKYIIAKNVGAIPDFIEHHNNGSIVQNVDQVVEELDLYRRNQKFLQEKVVIYNKTLPNLISWKKVVRYYTDLFEQERVNYGYFELIISYLEQKIREVK